MSNLRVATNSIQENLIRQLNQNQRSLVSLHNQLASGRKVSLPEDDPMVMGRTIRRESEKSELEQYHTNNLLAQTVIKTSNLNLDQLRSFNDLALGIANTVGDSSTDVELAGYKTQLDEILNQALDTANAEFDGEYLFAGVDYSNPPFSIDDGGTPNDPSDDTIQYNGSPTDPADPNFTEAETYVGKDTKVAARLNPEYNEDIQFMLQGLLDLRNSMDTSIAPFSASNSRDIASQLEDADDRVVVATSDLITKQMRLELANDADTSLYNQLDQSIANEVAANITELAVMLKQNQTSYEAALSSASRIMNISLLNYI